MSIINSSIENLKKVKYGVRGGWQSIKDINSRSGLSIFDYTELMKPLDFYPFVPHKENNLYGNGSVIQASFPHLDFSETTIEHGLYIGSLVPSRHLKSRFKNIITFSEYRKKFIGAKTEQNIIAVGPYINYTKSLYDSEKLLSEKDKLGKTLVVFPSHSIDSVYANHNITEFIKYIEIFKEKYRFDSILVCMYWKDIELNNHKEYELSGFRIVTAGHSYDANFLSRLKTILLISDAVLTNSVGTHVGYSVSLNRPIQIWNGSKLEYLPILGQEDEAKKELSQRQGDDLNTHLNDIEHIKTMFFEFDESISTPQLECVEYYWGSSPSYLLEAFK